MFKGNYELEVLVNGKPAREYFKDGKVFIEGRPGTKYSLRFRNNGYKRVVVAASVDGLSVMSGKAASYGDNGYVVNGYSSVVIDGWRKSDNEVAEFYFTTPSDSYAGLKGEGDNIGVIGAAVVKEKDMLYDYKFYYSENKPHYNPTITYSASGVNINNASFSGTLSNCGDAVTRSSCQCSSLTGLSKQEVGTGWGDDKKSEVVKVGFEREDKPDEVFNIWYNTRTELEKMGIDFRSNVKYVTPNAFPGEYCEPPKRK